MSTASTYFDAVFREAHDKSLAFSTYRDDLWAYQKQGQVNSFWTGYFSTEPEFKLEVTQYAGLA